MAVINLKKREVQIKVVYYGPGRGGKTTNLDYIHQKNKGRSDAGMVKINTRGERTLLFDYLPFEMGKINGFDIKIQLYTAPGQQKYDSCRRLVLNGADGVVFVADSMAVCRKRNMVAFESLKMDLAYHNKNVDQTPLVLQCNKADLGKEGVAVLSSKTIIHDLRIRKNTPVLEASALLGRNVVSTLKKIIVLALESVEVELKKHVAERASSPAAARETVPARAYRAFKNMAPSHEVACAPAGA